MFLSELQIYAKKMNVQNHCILFFSFLYTHALASAVIARIRAREDKDATLATPVVNGEW